MNPTSLRTKSLLFHQSLIKTICPKNQSDRTSFKNIANWLLSEIESGRFNEGIFQRVLSYAVEASLPTSRNPAAVFTSILKKELSYGKKSEHTNTTHPFNAG